MLRALWQRIAGIFGGKKQQRPPGGIPAPETLVARVAAVKDKDRDMLRLADEAIRRGHPDQAVLAYWKAVRMYTNDGQHLKAVSALKMILQHVPDSVEAHLALIEAYVALSRTRDAANACIALADAHVEVGRRDEALAVLARALHLDPLIRGARERISALGGVLPTAAPAPPPVEEPPAEPLEPAPTPTPAPASEPAPRSGGLPKIQPLPTNDDGPLELDIEGDAALDFPDDSLVLPVPEPDAPRSEPAEDLEGAATMLAMDAETIPRREEQGAAEEEGAGEQGAATMAMSALTARRAEEQGTETEAMSAVTAPQIEDEGDATVAMPAVTAPRAEEEGAATVAMPAVTAPRAEEDGAATLLQADELSPALEDRPTDEVAPRRPGFAIPNQATAFDGGLPSALVGSEHDPSKEADEPAIGGPTKAYGPDELRALGIKVPED